MHIPTLFAVNIGVSALISLILLIMAVSRYRPGYLWTWAMVMHGAGYTLGALRGHIDNLWSIVLGNTAFALCLALLGEGLYRFQGKPSPRLLIWTPVASTLLLFSWFINAMTPRLLYGGLILLVQLLICLAAVWPARGNSDRGPRLTAAGLLVALCGTALRVVLAATGMGPDTLFNPNTAYSLIAFANSVALLLVLAGMILMVLENRHEALRETQAQYKRLIDAAHEGICLVRDGQCIFANASVAAALGLTKADLVGTQLLAFVHPAEQEMMRALTQTTDDAVIKLGQTSILAGIGLATATPAYAPFSSKQKTHDIRLLTNHAGPRWFRVSSVGIDWYGHSATLLLLSDIHERRERQAKTYHLAHRDELTGLSNRRHFMQQLQQASATRHHGQTITLMLIDLDKFKQLNDHYGHQAGDRVLAEAASRLQTHAKAATCVARLSGDEFAILFEAPGTRLDQLQEQMHALATRILQALEQPYPIDTHSGKSTPAQQCCCTASIGIAVSAGADKPADTLLADADAAMYVAKRGGHSKIHVARR
jgi:diguanylate cyclase (GGDEF)-like protein